MFASLLFLVTAYGQVAGPQGDASVASADDPVDPLNAIYLEERLPRLLGWDELSQPADAVSVVGGQPVQHGGWADVAAVVFYGQYVGCTGTLIAPDLVLTAAHCADGISHVILDTRDYNTNQGEMIAVERTIVHSSYYSGGYDIAVLELTRATAIEPRRIATDCIRDEQLSDGADVAVVGYGAINERGDQYSTQLREGYTTIDDAECNSAYADGVYMGCAPSINPGGEIGAGGDGVDACFGDSGGPLYLLTDDGEAYLTGVTSRAYAGIDPSYPCRDGGIFVRADAVMDWVESATGRTLPRPQCNQAPSVTTHDLVVASGDTARATLSVQDDGTSFTVDLVAAPTHGTLTVAADGVTYTADEGYVGSDEFEVRVTDDGSPYAGSGPLSTTESVSVEVVAADAGRPEGDGLGDDPSADAEDDEDEDEDDDDDEEDDEEDAVAYQRLGRGCAFAGTNPAAGTLLLLPVALLRRRRP